jgi:AcrR family transcriptional regulator
MVAGPTRRTQEQRRAETERRVIDAAVTLIAAHGSHSVTLQQVGEAAGYSRGIVHHHFGSRERLLAAVIAEAATFPLPEYDGNGLDHLAAILETYLRNVVKRNAAARAFLRLWGEAIAADPMLAPLFATQDDSFRSFLAERVRVGIADGSMRADTDPTTASAYLFAVMRGIGLQLIAAPSARNLTDVIRDAQRTTRAAFGA